MAAVTASKDGLKTDLDIMSSRLEKLHEVLEERRFDAVDKALQSQDYVEAKTEYESAKSMLKEMKLTNSARRIALKIPRMPITIHEEPGIAKVPVSSGVGLAVVKGVAIGTLLGLVCALPISLLMILKN